MGYTFPAWDTASRNEFQAARQFNLPPGHNGTRMRRAAAREFTLRHPSLLESNPDAIGSLAAAPRCSTAQRDQVYRDLGLLSRVSQSDRGYERYSLLRSCSNPEVAMKDVWRLREKECRTCFEPKAEPSKDLSLPAAPVASTVDAPQVALPPHEALRPTAGDSSLAPTPEAVAASLRSKRAEAQAQEAAAVVVPACQQVIDNSFWSPQRPRYGLRDSEPTRFENNFIATKMANSVRNQVSRR